MDEVTVMYQIIGKIDGRWVVRAFDGNGAPLGIEIHVNSTDAAYKVWCVLNGISDADPTLINIPVAS